MTTEVTVCKFRCNCGTQYESRDDAEDCKRAHIQKANMPVQAVEDSFHSCEMCEDLFASYGNALDCERMHKRKKDIHYENHLRKLSFEKLALAAAHPTQTRLLMVWR